jgi:ABC-2 type transport system ATP-binding protein
MAYRCGGGLVITARGLTKRYRGTLAVDDLTFEVRPGEVTGFLGPNGSGKSTTMRLILGLDYPDAGRAMVNGRRYADLSWPLREVGSLLEARAFNPGRSGFHHLLALAQANDIPRSRVGEVLDMVGLTKAARKRAGTFSLGMGQRLGIAVALLGDPGVLLFDEPINGLDPDGIIWVRNLLKRLAADGRTVFVSSHLISELALSAERLVVIGQGRLIAETSVAELIAASPGRYVRVRSPQQGELLTALREAGAAVRREDDGALAVAGLDAHAIAEAAARRQVVLHELSPQSASLEEAFLQLTHGALEYQGGADRPDKSRPDKKGRP